MMPSTSEISLYVILRAIFKSAAYYRANPGFNPFKGLFYAFNL